MDDLTHTTSMMALDLALTDVYASLMESGIEFASDIERTLFYAFLREAFLLGQRDILDKITPMVIRYTMLVARALEED